MKFSPGFGVMEKIAFAIPEDNVGYSEIFDWACAIADRGRYRRVVEMWKENGAWHFGDETLYRSHFWPGRAAYTPYRKVRQG